MRENEKQPMTYAVGCFLHSVFLLNGQRTALAFILTLRDDAERRQTRAEIADAPGKLVVRAILIQIQKLGG